MRLKAEVESLLHGASASKDKAAEDKAHPTLPPGLAEFQPLQGLESVKAFKAPLKELEAAFLTAPSGAAAEALLAKVQQLRAAMQTTVDERLATPDIVPACDAVIAAGSALFTDVYVRPANPPPPRALRRQRDPLARRVALRRIRCTT